MAVPVETPHRDALVDIVGTGGDQLGTFNISTTAAFVVAGAGVKVAKHGNRAASSRCGSADVLEALGVRTDLTPDEVATCIEQVGMGFMLASLHHPVMGKVAPIVALWACARCSTSGPADQPRRRAAAAPGGQQRRAPGGAGRRSGPGGLPARAAGAQRRGHGRALGLRAPPRWWRSSEGWCSLPIRSRPEECGVQRWALRGLAAATPTTNAFIVRGVLNGCERGAAGRGGLERRSGSVCGRGGVVHQRRGAAGRGHHRRRPGGQGAGVSGGADHPVGRSAGVSDPAGLSGADHPRGPAPAGRATGTSCRWRSCRPWRRRSPAFVRAGAWPRRGSRSSLRSSGRRPARAPSGRTWTWAELVAQYEAAGAAGGVGAHRAGLLSRQPGRPAGRRPSTPACLCCARTSSSTTTRYTRPGSAGASAVLLIAALLGRPAAAASWPRWRGTLGLDVLLEVHDAAEMERALTVEGAVMGINNRDLRTFAGLSGDDGAAGRSGARRAAAGEREWHTAPATTCADWRRLGVDAVLVGESLLVAGDVQEAIRADGLPSAGRRPRATLESKEAR